MITYVLIFLAGALIGSAVVNFVFEYFIAPALDDWPEDDQDG